MSDHRGSTSALRSEAEKLERACDFEAAAQAFEKCGALVDAARNRIELAQFQRAAQLALKAARSVGSRLGQLEGDERDAARETAVRLCTAEHRREGAELLIALDHPDLAHGTLTAHERISQAAERFERAAQYLLAAQCYLALKDEERAFQATLRVARDDGRYRISALQAIQLCNPARISFKLEQFLLPLVSSGPINEPEASAFASLSRMYRAAGFPESAEEVLRRLLAFAPGHRALVTELDAIEKEIAGSSQGLEQSLLEDPTFHPGARDRSPSPQAHPLLPPLPPLPRARSSEPGAAPTARANISKLARGTLIDGRYRIDRELGHGGMSVVYAAEDKNLGIAIALKFYTTSAHDPDEQHALFRRELLLTRQLAHPNIVRVFDMGTYEGSRFITMELLEGEGLDRKLARPMPLGTAVDYLVQACRGLGEAHARGIVHRDIKPANLFITREGVLKLMDFGIARALSDPFSTNKHMIKGTPRYMAPEQISGGSPVSFATDLYALGVVGYELLTGQRPFDHGSSMALMMMHLTKHPPAPRSINPRIPTSLDAVIQRLLEKDPSLRFASSDALARELEAIASSSAL
jgi:serine/threonine-protein kinase